MTTFDNLETAINNSKVIFDSLHPLDKIVYSGTLVTTNNGDTTGATGNNTGPQAAKIQLATIANPYSKKCFVRFVWAIDGVNFNSAETHLLYTFNITYTDIPATSSNQQGLRAAVSMAIDANTITFQTANGYHGNVSTTSGNPNNGYTPTSQTYTIKYYLFEMEPYVG